MTPTRDELHRLYTSEKMSLAEIGTLYGVSKTSVRRWLIKAGIEARGISEATSLATKGKPLSAARKAAIAKNLPKMWIARQGPEAIEKHKATMKAKYEVEVHPNKGRVWSEKMKAAQAATRSSPEYRATQADAHRGEKSHLWRGGKLGDEDLRMQGWQWRLRRRECYERDRWTCHDCGCKCLGAKDAKAHGARRIQAHHLVARRDGGTDDLSNLVTLCASCHRKREKLN